MDFLERIMEDTTVAEEIYNSGIIDMLPDGEEELEASKALLNFIQPLCADDKTYWNCNILKSYLWAEVARRKFITGFNTAMALVNVDTAKLKELLKET